MYESVRKRKGINYGNLVDFFSVASFTKIRCILIFDVILILETSDLVVVNCKAVTILPPFVV